MTLTAFINVPARYIFLASMPWVDELNKVGLVILTYLGASVALKRGAHLGLTVVTDLLPKKAQDVLFIFGCAVGVFFCYVAVKYGYSMTVSEYNNNVLSQGMEWPEYLYAMWLPIGCLVLGIRFIQEAYYKMRDMMRKGETLQ